MEDREKFEFTLGDRLRRSMKVGKFTVQGMADFLGVTRETVSTWINDRHAPNRQTLMLWSARTGAPLQWLTTGEWATESREETAPVGSGKWWREQDLD